ncbi:hypothetical protein O6H91_17G012200 [Diphasiastrum complanatum]|uniref:Uncharacterized protein n=1 Tax=Diphasiastrum complanatum TaxID=34168 RepID=A0ACC2B4B9_DIPCM|nr:hypothetical protein O6H91_17G012200 [Diphasiastrum complanatum]
MAGIALALDLLLTTPALPSKSLHSFASLAPVSAATVAKSAVSFVPLYPAFALQGLFSVCCQELIDKEEWDARWTFDPEAKYSEKTYLVEPKPLLSAFKPKALGATTVRALLVNYLPLLETYFQPEDDDSDDESDHPKKLPIDPIVPLKQSATHIVREVAVVTTRRVLERLVIHYVTDRVAWKLLKDVPKSAERKAGRYISLWELCFGVCRTTFRAHALGVAANWLVQESLDVYRSLEVLFRQKQGEGKDKKSTKGDLETRVLRSLARKTAGNTLKAGGSLIFASLGAGLGAVLIKPSTGTWIGCAVGDLAGTFLVGIWLDTWLLKAS